MMLRRKSRLLPQVSLSASSPDCEKKINYFIIICRHFKNISNYLVLLDIWRSWDKESVRRILMVKLTFFLRKLKLSPQLTSWHWLEQCLDCSWCQNQLTLLENYQNKKYWKICCCCVQLSLHSLSLPGNIFVRIKYLYFLQFFEGSGRPLDLPCKIMNQKKFGLICRLHLNPLFSTFFIMTSFIICWRSFMARFEEQEEFVWVLCSSFDNNVSPETYLLWRQVHGIKLNPFRAFHWKFENRKSEELNNEC